MPDRDFGSLFQSVEEITTLETTIEQLKLTHWEKQRPLQVAQTRLANRHQRPNIEKCRDEPTHRWANERRAPCVLCTYRGSQKDRESEKWPVFESTSFKTKEFCKI